MNATSKPSSGWNRSTSTPNPAPKKPSAFKGVLAGVLIVAALGAVCWFMFAGGDSSANTKRGKENSRNKKTERSQSVSSAVHPKAETDVVSSGKAKGTEVNNSKADPAENVETPGAEPEKEKPKTRRTFESGTDELIAMAMSTPPGSPMPPLPGISMGDSKRFVESLKKPIQVFDDDSDQIKAVKQLVQNTREEIAQLMLDNPNMTFADILQEHRKMHNEDVDVRNQTARELQKIIDEGDIEGAKKFRTTMNFALQQMGIKEIDTPITEEEKAEADAREAEEEAAAQEAEAQKGNK